MHSLKKFAVTLILAIIATKSCARPHDNSNNETVQDRSSFNSFSGHYGLTRRYDGSVIPLCRSICGDCTSGSTCSGRSSRKKLAKKKLPSLPESLANEKLEKKTLPPLSSREAAIKTYVKNKVTQMDENPGANDRMLAFDDTGIGYSTSIFADLRNGPPVLNIGVEGLCGCSLLVVVSENAVYMAHFFESLAFNPKETLLTQLGITAGQAFQQNVLDFLQNGYANNPGLSLMSHQPLFQNQHNVRAYIITPSKEDSPPTDADDKIKPPEPIYYYDATLYEDKISRLETWLNGALPGISIRKIRYDAADHEAAEGSALLDQDAGKALFEYDRGGIAGRGGTSNWAARLFSESLLVDTFAWSQNGMQAENPPGTVSSKRNVDAVDMEKLLCGTQTYSKHEATCYSDILCPIVDGVRTLLCGSECYHPDRHTCSTSELLRVKRDGEAPPSSSSITELVWDQSTVILASTTSTVTVTNVPVVLQSNGVVINNQTFALPPGQTNIVVVAQGLTLTIKQVPAPTQTAVPGPGPGTSAAVSFTPTRTSSSTTALIPSSVFSWPTVLTTTITTTDARGIETLTVTGTNSSGAIVPIIPISPAEASSSAAALAAELAAVSAAVAAFAADTAAGAAATAAVGAIDAAQSSAEAFGLALGTAAGLCVIFCDAAAAAAITLGSIETSVGSIVAGTAGAGALSGLAALLGGLTAAAGSLFDESTPQSTPQSGGTTQAPTSTSSCSTMTVTDYEILCGTALIDGSISTTVCSTLTSSIVTACSTTAVATTTYEAAFCLIDKPTPRTPVLLSDDGDLSTETIFCGVASACSNCTGSIVNGQAICAPDGPGLGCPCIPDSQTPGFTCPSVASCDAANCTGAFNTTDGKAYCTGYPAGCECIETVNTCGAKKACDSNECAGAFNMTDGKAYCTNHFAGCECQATANTCGPHGSCDGYNCQGAFNMNDGKAYCTNFFQGCECTPTTNTCGAKASCDSNECAGAFNMADGKSYCTNHFAGCECQATTNTCGPHGSCDGYNCQGAFNMNDGKAYCTNFFQGCECTPTTNTCGAKAFCDSNDCNGVFNMADGKAYCTNHFAGCECAPTDNTCGAWASCDDNNCAGAFDMGSGNAYCTNFFQGCRCNPTANTCGSHASCDDNSCNGAFNMNDGVAYCTGHFAGCQCNPTGNTCGAHASCDDNDCHGAFANNGVAYCTGKFAGCQCTPTKNTCGTPQRCENNGCAGSVDDHASQWATCKGKYAGCPCIATAYTIGYCMELTSCSFGTCAGHVPAGSNFGLCSAGRYLGCGCLKPNSGGGSGGAPLPPNLPCSAIPGCAMNPGNQGGQPTCKIAECQFISGVDSVGNQMGSECSCVCSDGRRWETMSYASPGSDCTPYGGNAGEETVDILCSLFWFLNLFPGIC